MNDTDAALIAYLNREADLDGLATIDQNEAAEAIGCSRDTVRVALGRLAAEGLLTSRGVHRGVPRGRGDRGLNPGFNYTEVQLSDEVFA